MPEPIRVLVCDDDLLARRAIVEFLGIADDIVLAGDVPDGRSAVDAVQRDAVDVVLMDIGMPGMSGIEAAAAIRQARPSTRVLMLTALDDPERVLDSLASGAAGFLLKDVSPDTLIEAVRSAHKGLRVLSAGPLQHMVDYASGPAGPVPELTERERLVLGMLCRGASNGEISRELFLSASSVKASVSALMVKLNATSRLHTVARAHELKLDRPT